MEKSDSKIKFIHRDLSWLAFNERVLEEALDESNPLLERLKFIAICANNLDEFLMVRVAGLKRLLDAGYNHKDNFGYYPSDLSTDIQTRIASLIERLYCLYDLEKGAIRQELARNQVFILNPAQLNSEQKRAAKNYFESTLYPIITPMAIDPGHPFPILASKTNAFAVLLGRNDTTYLAMITIPKSVPRLFKLPSEKEDFSFIRIDEIIRENMEAFFIGFQILGSFLFRVIRDSELSAQEEYHSDLLKVIENEIQKRPKAKVVNLQVEKNHHSQLLDMLAAGIDFPKNQVTFIDGDLDLTYLFEVPPQVSKPALFFKSFTPARMDAENIFDRIKENDFIRHFPFQSFQPTVDLIQSAARDKDVLAMKMTLYRASENSGIIKALIEAAKNKKQVTVLVEIKARFEEERNIDWTRELEAAGCHVIYGIVGMKIHSKMTLIVRREEGRIRRYVHLSTGNYNEKTAELYTDVGYFTANEDFAKDISDVFNVITGYSLPSRWHRIVSAPYDLRQYFFELIDKEIAFHKKYKNGLIFAKFNSLEDTAIIEKLYEASNAGVKIKLIVRGICCLVPGVAGMSENIEVKSLVGRFLEHSRIYMFNNNSESRVFLSSADWMTRNFDRRVELLFEVNRDELRQHLKFVLEEYWQDNRKSRWLTPGREYIRPDKVEHLLNVQEQLIGYYAQ
ncbi:MAG: polyphosphate kinase 1 [Candidatus Omnitrophica bacterium]|nr:polyphosphate kinase 1 [Candidatus Omnitrophota bacterium]